MKDKIYYDWLQVGRFLAALWVMLHHGQRQLFFPYLESIEHTKLFGHYGVDFFFVLSGFIIMVTCQGYFGTPKRTGEFLIKRFARIYPLVFLLCVPRIALDIFSGIDIATTLQQFISDVLLLPTNTKHMINTAWSLRFEMFFYVAFAFLMIFGKKLFWSVISTVLIFVVFFNFRGDTFEGVNSYLFSKWNVLFIFGCFLGEFESFFRAKPVKTLLIAIVCMIIGVSGISQSGIAYNHADKNILEVIWSSFFFSGVILGLCVLDYKQVRAPKILILLGGASYCIYLLHGSILFHIRQILHDPLILCSVSWLAVILILFLSCLIYIYYEKTTNNWLRARFLDNKRES